MRSVCIQEQCGSNKNDEKEVIKSNGKVINWNGEALKSNGDTLNGGREALKADDKAFKGNEKVLNGDMLNGTEICKKATRGVNGRGGGVGER